MTENIKIGLNFQCNLLLSHIMCYFIWYNKQNTYSLARALLSFLSFCIWSSHFLDFLTIALSFNFSKMESLYCCIIFSRCWENVLNWQSGSLQNITGNLAASKTCKISLAVPYDIIDNWIFAIEKKKRYSSLDCFLIRIISLLH